MPETNRYPEYEKHQRTIRALKQDLAALILERHELEFHARKNIEAEYMHKIGSLEYKAFELNCKVLRLKRKYELVSAAVKSRELIEVSHIDAQLVAEFNTRNEKLSEAIGRMKEALEHRFSANMLSEEEAEMRQLYAVLLKKLHPDLHPVQNEKTAKLFSAAIEAYRNADLSALRAICVSVEDRKELMDTPVGSMDHLLHTEDQLQDMIGTLQRDIRAIKNTYPCNQKELLEDEERLRERVNAVINRITEYRNTCEDLEKRLAKLLGKSVWIR
ncbi:hypothetical protein AGMMS49942_07310 [Spirochaetia bacterium]|nr:hypothetical protein AGMMS49942_07310 [Spirochaetia bacterium]